LNNSSTPTLTQINNGTLIYQPSDSAQGLRFGFAAGAAGGASWNEDFSATIINTGTNTTTDWGWDMELSLTTPNDGGANFTIYVIGENGAGTRQFESSSVAPNNGFTSTNDLKASGILEVVMDYDSRVITIHGKSLV
jgi:hypothetical protein